jgi:protein phosphatase
MQREAPAGSSIRREMRPAVIAVDQRHLEGPFDVIGDVHGCLNELNALLQALGYRPDSDAGWRSPAGRLPVFLGDLVDRGPDSLGVVTLVARMVAADAAFAVPGNHDIQFERHLSGEPVPLLFGLDGTVREFDAAPAAAREAALAFFRSLPGHLILDGGRLVIAHTGLAADMHGVDTAECRHLAAYGVHDDAVDPRDVALRHPWIGGYRADAVVVYGHTPVLEAVWRGNTIGIDTGCVFGWRLTALRWPERTLVSVPAEKVHATRRRPFLPETRLVAP